MALRFRWVVRGVLAGMERPGSYHPFGEDLALLRQESIGQVLCLTEQSADTVAATSYQAAGITFHHVPITDFDAPSVAQVETVLALIDAGEARGRATLVHCLAGLGRTGTVAACYLAHRHGLSGIAAIRAAREIEPGYVQSTRQEDCVIAFAAGRAAG